MSSISGISNISSITKSKAINNNKSLLPISILLNVQKILKKSIFSRKFYQEINDKVLSKSSTVDQNLYFICYFTLLISAILNNKPKIIYFLKNQWYKFIQLIKNTTGISSTTTTTTTTATTEKQETNRIGSSYLDKILNPKPPIYIEGKPSKLAYHLKKINSYLADIRIFNRLTDSIKYMPWIIDEYQSFININGDIPKFDRFINLLQSLNCLILEILENLGWLTDHDWISTGNNEYWCIETYIWCCRVWGVYLLIEIMEIIRKTPMNKWLNNKQWQINLFKNIIQLPLVLHWSLRNGCLSPFWVGVCGSGASWWNFKDMWMSIDLS
ncbi:conserved hypothetical protein [Candida dubliniensis CD36]|uniref:Uncharacterized protein n=1 Tax=Candida dubliniensis (strain CD36 / ATCC MYA-646 / CBS 7987 / NCPF 3949 / NRRL Y-17841) TaxID=573826 RepID=B9WGU0_CANDC|nr:conserved hypothetical protein [Candida dubliniensis CD36]CAX42466.1 conserved hypothetical protein [Candida dubliniensis CD36]